MNGNQLYVLKNPTTSRILQVDSGVDRTVLFQNFICSSISSVLLFMGQPELAGRFFFVLLCFFLFINLLTKKYQRYAALSLSVIPMLMLLRNTFFFHSVTVILMFGVIFWILSYREDFIVLQKTKILPILYIASFIYWILSFYQSGQYYMNLRAFELLASATLIFLLARYSSWFSTFLVGLGINGIALAVALLPYGDRLGASLVGDTLLGNPMSVGIPLALMLIVLIVERGKWLYLQEKPLKRYLFLIVFSTLLILSTSRGSWLVAIVDLLALFLLSRFRQRVTVVFFVILLVAIFIFTLSTPQGQYITRWYEKIDNASSAELAWAKATTGRSYQWEIFWRVLENSPVMGYGPGRGVLAYQNFLFETGSFLGANPYIQLHSLYLQIGTETGLLGLGFLLGVFIYLLHRGYRLQREAGEIIPLLGLLGFMTILVSTSGFDAASGIFLGIGIISLLPFTVRQEPEKQLKLGGKVYVRN